MNLYYEDYTQLSHWSPIDLAYIRHDPRLKPFYEFEPGRDTFPEVILSRKKNPVDRSLLLSVLKKQYQESGAHLPVDDDVILSEDTFTITTAHQPTLLTGPLFHIYKIASTINLANELNATYPDQRFLPVFVISGEDHDWPEVNHVYLFGKKIEWNRSASGPCGRMSTDGMENVIASVNELFKNSPFGKDIDTLLNSCLQQAQNYGHFHWLLIHSLFAHHGLIIINPDDSDLKNAFAPLMEKEIRVRFSYNAVTPVQADLEKAGFKPQAFCRPVNLFYMTDDKRERLDPHEDGLIRVDSRIKYSIDEAVTELKTHPDRFSPNVIMRPLYQEFILPNIAYVGGGGEIAYWLDRKIQFAEAGVHYPMLIRRNSLLLLEASIRQQLDKLGIEWKDMFRDLNAIVKTYLQKHSQSDLNYSPEMEMIRNAYQQLAAKAKKMDPTLASAIQAEEIKQLKQFEHLGSRLMRTEKQQQDNQVKKIERLKEKLFPGNGLQERHENFLSYYASFGPAWIDDMVKTCDPLMEKFILAELTQQLSPTE